MLKKGRWYRKGQSITAYIIIGIIILIAAALISTQTAPDEIKIDPITYPTEVQPVAEFITQCAQLEGNAAVTLASSQAGFVEIPPFIKFEPQSHLTLDQLGMRQIPYWSVPGEERIPPLDYIENQLSAYVTNKTIACLNNFEDFTTEYEVIPINTLKMQTLMGDENVVFKFDYPLRVMHKPSGVEFTIRNFVAFVPIRFKKMHELAEKIMKYENDVHPIENATIDLMAADPEVPLDGLLFDCGGKNWPMHEVKDRLQRSLAQNLNTIRIKNTNHPPFEMDLSVYRDLSRSREKIISELNQGLPDVEDSPNYPKYTPADAWEYFHTYYDVGAKPTEMNVAFEYRPDFGMLMDVQPNNHGMLSTRLMQGASKWLQYICVNGYHFVYDLNFPLRVGIYDPVSNYGTGATFEFAFPVMIDDNTPSRNGVKSTVFPTLSPEVSYCDTAGGHTIDLRARGYYTADLPSSELKNVEFEFQCVTKRCKLGVSKADNGIYRLRTTLPQCANPLIKATKEGYLPAEDFLRERLIVLDMTQLKSLALNVVRHKYDPVTGEYSSARSLKDNQEVSIYVSNDKESFVELRTYPYDDMINIIDDTTTYSFKAILRTDEVTTGGYFAEELEIPYSYFGGADTLTLHVFDYPDPSSSVDQQKMTLLLGQEEYKEQLRPTFD